MSVKRVIAIGIFIIGFSLPCALGVWQLQRADWKADIITQLTHEYQKDADAYELKQKDFFPDEEGAFKVIRGHVSGKFITEQTLYWPNIKDGNYVLEMLTPFQLQNTQHIIMVNRGYVFEDLQTKQPLTEISAPTKVTVQIQGMARAHEHNSFSFENDPTQNRWYRFDPDQIGVEMGINSDLILPFILYAERASGSEQAILGEVQVKNAYPRDNHHQYALFWFSMAGLWALILGWKIFYNKRT